MNTKRLIYVLSIFLSALLIISCSKDEKTDYSNLYNLPADTGGVQISNPLGSTDSPYGYYVYIPSYYDDLKESEYPVLIFLHGSGEIGNSQTNPADLDKILVNGPPKMIKNKTWGPRFPMLVFSPQCHDNYWNSGKIKSFIEYILANYKINPERIYLTGLSLGGHGTFYYIGTYGDESYIAAAVPICGGGDVNSAANFKHIPIWAFHGEDDPWVAPSNSINMINAINEAHPDRKALVTIFPGIDHNSWDYTYEGTGIGKESPDYDAFDRQIYDWMFQYSRPELDSLRNLF